ncbi:hypothetical protein GEV33_008616 [Tenebrio molitor]|uniref:Uncharacterized protein n=1 Tax=Tenebrio molitor TaxID=7067 RepID=A0A8J6HGE3_TENMO|nr:hypothetical protein GEV33_008616 [Tenebrio molitor]
MDRNLPLLWALDFFDSTTDGLVAGGSNIYLWNAGSSPTTKHGTINIGIERSIQTSVFDNGRSLRNFR